MKNIILSFSIILFLFGCTKDNNEIKEPELLGIYFDAVELTMNVGDSYQFNVKTIPDNFSVEKYNWSIISEDGSGDGIINEWGFFTATNPGRITIRVETPTSNGTQSLSCEAQITIRGIEEDHEEDQEEDTSPITSITLSGPNAIYKNEETDINYVIEPINADYKEIQWESSDENILLIENVSSNKITVKGISDGDAIIYAKAGNKTYRHSIKVKKIKIQKITVTPADVTINTGEQLRLSIDVYPSNSDENITYIVSDEKIAYFSNKNEGIITALSPGTCIVTISTEDGRVRDNCMIHVIDVPFYQYFKVTTKLNGTYNNGFITGDIYLTISNLFNNDVTIKRFYIFDYHTQNIIYETSNCGIFYSGSSKDYTFTFNNVYEPSYNWEIEYNGEEYYVKYADDYNSMFNK